MPRWVRISVTACCFALFFGITTLWGLLLVSIRPLRRNRPRDSARFTRSLNVGLGRFTGLLRDVGLIAYWPPQLPLGYEGRPFVLIANHPTLLDVILIMSSIPDVVCVVKAAWHHSIALGPVLRLTEYLPGPGYVGDSGSKETAPVVARIERKLRAGVPVVVFPEGSRSPPGSLRRFRRGAIEAAVAAEVPILPLFIGVDRPFLTKGHPFWEVPKEGSIYYFEWLEPVETAGRNLDSRQLTREISAQYRARFERLLEERKALELSDSRKRRRRKRSGPRTAKGHAIEPGLEVAPAGAPDEDPR